MELGNSGAISVLIVDDDERYRRLLRSMLEKGEDFQVLAEASDVREALELIDKVIPDLIIMDVQMKSMDGFEGTKAILGHHPNARVVLVSRTGNHQNYACTAKKAGAIAFIRKMDLSISVLREALLN